ncbi:MAG: protein kinase, partial [Phycisphaerales bacterium]
MRPEPAWATVNSICLRAMDLAPRDQGAFVARRCDGDRDLERRVRELLTAAQSADAEGWLDPGELPPSDAEHDLQPGERLGAYEIVRPLSSGGMGSVHLARRADAAYEREVAIKVLRAHLTNGAMRDRFQRERATLARLTHPGITALLDGGTTADGRPYLVMEYVAGESIVRYAEGHGLSIAARLRLFLDVAGAVQHAHTRLIVHRDIKPSNVLVSADGRPRLIDFGIAKLIESGNPTGDPTSTATMLRTPAYASPEQIRGEPIGTFTDVHALGALLFELLAGHPVHAAADEPAYRIERRICEEAPPRPSATARPAEHQRHIRGELDAIVARAMAIDPADRYPTVETLADDIRRHLHHRPVQASPPPAWRRALKYARRNRAWVAAAVAGVGLVATAWTAVAVSAAEARQAAREADESRDAARLTTEVLEGVLASADPMATGQPPTVADVMRAVQAQIPALPAERADVQARLHLVLATSHLGMADFDRAATHAAVAVKGFRAMHDSSESQSDLASSLLVLGAAEMERAWLNPEGDPGIALDAITEALALRRGQVGEALPGQGVAEALSHLASATWVADRSPEGLRAAERLAREAIAILDRHPDGTNANRVRAQAFGSLGHALMAAGDRAGSAAAFEQALAIDAESRALPVRERHVFHRSLAGIAAADQRWDRVRDHLLTVQRETPRVAWAWSHVDQAWWLALTTQLAGSEADALAAGRRAAEMEAHLAGADWPEGAGDALAGATTLQELLAQRGAMLRPSLPSDATAMAVARRLEAGGRIEPTAGTSGETGAEAGDGDGDGDGDGGGHGDGTGAGAGAGAETGAETGAGAGAG